MVVLRTASRFLDLIQQRGALTPEVSQLLQQAQTALAHLADCMPTVALEVAVTLRRRTAADYYWCCWGVVLTEEGLMLSTRVDVAGHVTGIMVPRA
jgi:hypothetical protein